MTEVEKWFKELPSRGLNKISQIKQNDIPEAK
jgi:hypothetical protein